MNHNEISVIGAGTMGNGIAHVFALYGHEVNLIDLNKNILDNALKTIEKNLSRQLKKETITESQLKKALKNIKADMKMN